MGTTAGPQQRVLTLRELHLAEHDQDRVENRDVAKATGLRCATPTAVDVNHAVRERDIVVDPHHVRRFVEAHAAADQQRDERADVVVASARQLLDVTRGLQPHKRSFGDVQAVDILERVLAAPALLDEVVERGESEANSVLIAAFPACYCFGGIGMNRDTQR